jgi:dUTP pyrophosphatase
MDTIHTIQYFLEQDALASDVTLKLERKTEGASGYDLMANLQLPWLLQARNRAAIHTGLFLAMPIGVEGQIRTRSGLCRDHGISVLNSPGTIDSDYRGEIIITLMNHSTTDYVIKPGDRVAQLVFAPVFAWYRGGQMADGTPYVPSLRIAASMPDLERVSSIRALGLTRRGPDGHGSTGR